MMRIWTVTVIKSRKKTSRINLICLRNRMRTMMTSMMRKMTTAVTLMEVKETKELSTKTSIRTRLD